ncbi:glycosyltransferase family 2 protein [archaeon]|jgi:glycosyltransferase involved in cell wall biosynthesis|nr:glycosyltransferase family 2 protein [archaeon]
MADKEYIIGENQRSTVSEGPGIVSILTLNRLGLTKKAVDSILKNSRGDFRIVFLDNGSTDGTLEYLDELKLMYPSLVDVLKSDINLGVAKGRNKIFEYVLDKYGDNFKWVLSLDNDCTVHEGYDMALTNCINETGAWAVCPRLIQPDGKIFHDAHNGFLIDLNEMRLKLEYGGSVSMSYDDPKVSQRIETDVILGTSAKTPKFLKNVGFYDEGHKIGWEDFAIALKAFGLTGDSFSVWRDQDKHNGEDWVPLRKLADGNTSGVNVVYEPGCMITHDHPIVTEADEAYEKVRWDSEVIEESTDHFEKTWGVRPVL